MLAELIEKRARLHEQAQGIVNKAVEEKREMTAEEDAQFDAIHADIDKMRGTIDRMERQAAATAELERGNGRVTTPNVPATRHAPDPNGHPSYPAGYLPPAPARAAVIQTTNDEKLEAMRAWFLAGSDARPTIRPETAELARRIGWDINSKMMTFQLAARAPRSLAVLDAMEERAQATTPGASGGFTIPQETMGALERALLAFGGMRQVATVFRTDTGADMPIPTMNDTAQKGVILGENQQVANQDIAFGQLILQAFKYSSKLVLVSVEFLQDNAVNFAGFIGDALGQRIARIHNDHFTVGTGTGQPNGIVNAAVLGKTGTTGQTTSIIWDDLVDLEHAVDPSYRTGARFMFHDSSLKALKKIKNATTQQPLWLPGLASGAPDTILGYPYTVNQSMAVMAANAKSILFGQLSKYLIRDTRDITLLRLDERYADFHQVAFLAFSRNDGDLLDAGTHPVAYYANSAT